ncbi:MAG: sigma 54-interacting transcriptional regulator, partial [Halobacteriovoraceae bacterium]|nr:sigma 54-interacting transcriptional regulator [Halobacteriovoraceae bacterium]
MSLNLFQENLATMGDWLTFEPFDSRKSEMRLTRTKIEIVLHKGGSFKKSPCLLNFRGIGESARYELVLKNEDNKSFYELKALGRSPFLHNGTPTFHSRLRRNDRIDIDFNRFIVKSEDKLKEKDYLPVESWPKEMFINLEGETGTGKTTLARQLHSNYIGEVFPFVQVNLSAFSENLLESELFGHEKGAFTGATRERRGAIERASKGTLFIDEIDSLPLHLQVKLLTFLDDGLYQRVGGERFLKSSCRVAFASGRPLKALVEKGLLRKDLYFRLTSGFTFSLPTLRESPKLTNNLMHEFEKLNGVTISSDLKKLYRDFDWPGNIRQFKSHLLRKMYEDRGVTYLKVSQADADLVKPELELTSPLVNEVLPLREMTKMYCKSVLIKSSGSVRVAAKKLGVAPCTVRR